MCLAILLSTYNGERFLQEQLDSLLVQTYSNWTLIWRDDESMDRSRSIMASFSKKVGAERCLEVTDKQGHMGVMRSYLALLKAAENFPLVAFADQDDVWLEEKLSLAVAKIGGPDIPTLYCARQIIVNESLTEIGRSFCPKNQMIFPAALLQNIATGCTIVLNRAASNIITSTSPPSNSIHDWWSYLVVSAIGGHIIFDTTPTILYRQHGRNAIGSTPSILTRAWNAIRRGSGPYLSLLHSHAVALQASKLSFPAQNNTLLLDILSALNGNRWQRLGLIKKKDFRRQTFLENIILILWMLG